MKRFISLVLFLFSIQVFAGQVGEWRSHLAYNGVTEIARLQNKIFALAGGALFSTDTENGNVAYYNKQNSLNGSTISHIAANSRTGKLLVMYQDGLIDLMDADGNTTAMTDLYLKDISQSKMVNNIYMYGHYAYCAMSFGIMVINLQRKEITDVYYIGKDGSEDNILQTVIVHDTIYAISKTELIKACIKENLLDFNIWQRSTIGAATEDFKSIAAVDSRLYVIKGDNLYASEQYQWNKIDCDTAILNIKAVDNRLFCKINGGVAELKKGTLSFLPLSYDAFDIIPQGTNYWLAAGDIGIAYHSSEGDDFYRPDGPSLNAAYRMKVTNGRLYVVPGERWANQGSKPGYVMIYDGNSWTNITNAYITGVTGKPALDFMNVAVDPGDYNHFFVTSYGHGLFEFYGTNLYKQYTLDNSPLKSAANGVYADNYVRTDGAMYDDYGNLWVINASSNVYNLHIISPEQLEKAHTSVYAKWDTLNFYTRQKERISIDVPQEMFTDNRQQSWKWIPSARRDAGIFFYDDNSTPHYANDDYAVFRNSFVDQDNNVIMLSALYCMTQDRDGTMWIGTDKGLITIPTAVDFRSSNSCERIKIARNDGTNLADYLLSTEKVNAIAIDGSNRKWIGTETSGVYLLSEDGLETVEHFTSDNSPLLSDNVISIAINQQNGVVYIGTDEGIMSYQSDASEPSEDYKEAYAYPNPVREDYEGGITFTGLMDETVIHIADNGGNLVCETRSNGGLAVWNGCDTSGKRVSSGVYSAFCNSKDGKSNKVIKILVMH